MILNVSRKQNKFSCTLFTELHVCSQETRTLPQILDCFEYPKNPYLNQATQKHTCQIFLPPQKIPESKISNPENSIDHPLHLKSRVPHGGKTLFQVPVSNIKHDIFLWLQYLKDVQISTTVHKKNVLQLNKKNVINITHCFYTCFCSSQEI